MSNPFVHIELTTNDIGKAKSFYSALFDWELQDHDMGGGMTYTIINVGEGTGGGMFQMADVPPMWMAYVNVADIKAATEKAKSLGATTLKESQEVPNMGWFTIFQDPQGAILALWQQKDG